MLLPKFRSSDCVMNSTICMSKFRHTTKDSLIFEKCHAYRTQNKLLKFCKKLLGERKKNMFLAGVVVCCLCCIMFMPVSVCYIHSIRNVTCTTSITFFYAQRNKGILHLIDAYVYIA